MSKLWPRQHILIRLFSQKQLSINIQSNNDYQLIYCLYDESTTNTANSAHVALIKFGSGDAADVRGWSNTQVWSCCDLMGVAGIDGNRTRHVFCDECHSCEFDILLYRYQNSYFSNWCPFVTLGGRACGSSCAPPLVVFSSTDSSTLLLGFACILVKWDQMHMKA